MASKDSTSTAAHPPRPTDGNVQARDKAIDLALAAMNRRC